MRRLALLAALTFQAVASSAHAQGVPTATSETRAKPASTGASPHTVCGRDGLRMPLSFAPSQLDPAGASDVPAIFVSGHVFEPLVTQDYLSTTPRLVPNTTEALPEVSPDGLTYTFRLRRGIFFTDHPAFGGQPRELVAADYVYSIQRIFDPRTRAPLLGLLEGKIAGMAERQRRTRDGQPWDDDAPVEGLKALDRYTLQIRLLRPEPTFLYQLASVLTGAMAREVVEAHRGDIGAHPVGTGPYQVVRYDRGRKVVLRANPLWRGKPYTGTPSPDDPLAKQLLARHGGERLPRIPCVELTVVEEGQPRWLAFLRGDFDIASPVPPELAAAATPGGQPSPRLQRQGIATHSVVIRATTFTFFNLEDPVLGGYGAERVALRRALVLAYDVALDIANARGGRAVPAQAPAGPGLAGHDPTFRSRDTVFDMARAKALLDLYGYTDRDGDGWRDRPDGSPLALQFATVATAAGRSLDEVWQRSLNRLGVRVRFKPYPTAELIRVARSGQFQAGTLQYGTPVPDALGMLVLLHGAKKGNPNFARFDLPEFNRLYDEAIVLPDGPERQARIDAMNRLVIAYAPWRLGVHAMWTYAWQPWVSGWRPGGHVNSFLHYLSLDAAVRERMSGQTAGTP